MKVTTVCLNLVFNEIVDCKNNDCFDKTVRPERGDRSSNSVLPAVLIRTASLCELVRGHFLITLPLRSTFVYEDKTPTTPGRQSSPTSYVLCTFTSISLLLISRCFLYVTCDYLNCLSLSFTS